MMADSKKKTLQKPAAKTSSNTKTTGTTQTPKKPAAKTSSKTKTTGTTQTPKKPAAKTSSKTKTTGTTQTPKKPAAKTSSKTKTTGTTQTPKKPAAKTSSKTKTTGTTQTPKKPTAKTSSKTKTTGTTQTPKKPAAKTTTKKTNTTRIKKTEKKKPLTKTKTGHKKKQLLPFQIGEYIFYPNEGLGHITDIENLELRGEVVPYYVIHFHAQKMINRIPIHNTKLVKMRKVISKQAAKNILKIFEKEPEKNDLSWKDRLAMYQTINEKGNCIEIAQMLVSLYYRRQSKSNLSFQERQVFDFSIGALSNELAVVLGISNEEAMNEIISRLSLSYKKTEEEHIKSANSEDI